jgi:two-component system, OmpR family, response regulator RegX3
VAVSVKDVGVALRTAEPASEGVARQIDLDSPSILLVEDGVSELSYALEMEGFLVSTAADGLSALELAAENSFDLVLLDLRLPKLSGFEVCRRLRMMSTVRIVIFSGSDAEADRVRSLEMGADDFLTKPLSVTELTARIRAMLRRRDLDRGGQGTLRRVGGLTIDLARHEVRVDGDYVPTTRSELKILALLSEAPGRAYSRTEIMQELWQSDHVGDQRACDIHIQKLRRKIEADPAYPTRLLTVRGFGYKLVSDRV